MLNVLLSALIIAFCLCSCSETQKPYQPTSFSEDLLKKAEAGNAEAQLQIAGAYKEGRGVEKNAELAFQWASKSADQGFPLAQIVMGESYYYGEGVEKNYQKAFEYFKKAAESGSAEGQFKLAGCYGYGIGTSKNDEEAVMWLKKAAKQKLPEAMRVLGKLYQDGNIVPKDLDLAFDYFTSASELGDIYAQMNLGFCYLNGGRK